LAIDYTFHLLLYAATVAIIWGLVGYLTSHAPGAAVTRAAG